jgi:hypothetical protein
MICMKSSMIFWPGPLQTMAGVVHPENTDRNGNVRSRHRLWCSACARSWPISSTTFTLSNIYSQPEANLKIGLLGVLLFPDSTAFGTGLWIIVLDWAVSGTVDHDGQSSLLSFKELIRSFFARAEMLVSVIFAAQFRSINYNV